MGLRHSETLKSKALERAATVAVFPLPEGPFRIRSLLLYQQLLVVQSSLRLIPFARDPGARLQAISAHLISSSYGQLAPRGLKVRISQPTVLYPAA